MTIKQAIKKAFKAGWKIKGEEHYGVCVVSGNRLVWDSNEGQQATSTVLCLEDVFLDPLFWQSLFGNKKVEIERSDNHGSQEQWLWQWHYFIDHLATGEKAEVFFEHLNQNKINGTKKKLR